MTTVKTVNLLIVVVLMAVHPACGPQSTCCCCDQTGACCDQTGACKHGEVLVGFRDGLSMNVIELMNAVIGATILRELGHNTGQERSFVIGIPKEPLSVCDAVNYYKSFSDVEYACPNWVLYLEF